MSLPAPATTSQPRPVIFDVGLHHGEDTDFYLKKGFDVVAVEADPRHVTKARDRFADALAEGRLEIVSAAIAEQPGEIEFFVNLDKDDWSSTDPEYGARAGTRHERIRVPAMRFEDLYRRVLRSGIGGGGNGDGLGRSVYYVKADIEGGDVHVMRGLAGCDALDRPRYVSCEAHKLEYAAIMSVMGYGRFKLVNQNLNWIQKLPNPPKEGSTPHFEYQFKGHSSGPFGEEAPGPWMSLEQVAELYLMHKRMAATCPTITNAWFDFHAGRD